jgi:hypothetical protein
VRFRFRQPAPPGTIFAPTAFDDSVGAPLVLVGLGQDVTGRLIGAVVVEAGTEVELEVELDTEAP